MTSHETPPALIAQNCSLAVGRATGPDGMPMVILSARNGVVRADAPVGPADLDKLISTLTELRKDMPGAIVVAAADSLPGLRR